MWRPFTWKSWNSITSLAESASFRNNDYEVPTLVMATAATPANESESWVFSLDVHDDPSQKLYMYMHFSEVENLTDQIREFTISINGEQTYNKPFSPTRLPVTIYSTSSNSGSTAGKFEISLTRTERSTLPPIINALEVYILKQLSQSSTLQDDGRFCSVLPCSVLPCSVLLCSFQYCSVVPCSPFC